MTTATASSLTEKTQELCQTIVDDPAFSASQRRIEAFFANDGARAVFTAWQEKGRELHALGHQGAAPSTEDMAELERLQAAVQDNPVAADFVSAEEEMNSLFAAVTTRVQKTFQLGRVPTDDDLDESGCCGSGGGSGGGCGCSH